VDKEQPQVAQAKAAFWASKAATSTMMDKNNRLAEFITPPSLLFKARTL
jgi:hypothetical protein